jgi:hypothetical protein
LVLQLKEEHWLSRLKKKKKQLPNNMLPASNSFPRQRHIDGDKGKEMAIQAKGVQKQAGIAILTSENTNLNQNPSEET